MAYYDEIKDAIASVVRPNGERLINGSNLQETLFSMVDSLGAGASYAGIATLSTNPGTPDGRVFYFAGTAGAYPNFGGIVVNTGELAILFNTSTGGWAKSSLTIPAGVSSTANMLTNAIQVINLLTWPGSNSDFASMSIGDIRPITVPQTAAGNVMGSQLIGTCQFNSTGYTYLLYTTANNTVLQGSIGLRIAFEGVLGNFSRQVIEMAVSPIGNNLGVSFIYDKMWGNVIIMYDDNSDIQFGSLPGDLTYAQAAELVANGGVTNQRPILTSYDVIDHYNSTSATSPLSAGRGKDLNDRLARIEEMEYAYGIEWDLTVADPTVKRIGNLSLHKSLPIQNRMKRFLLNDDGTDNYYLDTNDSTKKADGTNAVLDGTDGQVAVKLPLYYGRFTFEGSIFQCLISEYPLPGYHLVPEYYISAYQATIDRTITSAPKLASVVNTTAAFRGGNNTAEWDGTYRSLLGVPASNVSLNDFRTYARNRGVAGMNGAGWNCEGYDIHKSYTWLYYIEYANFNCQLDFNADLTSEGYKQGGLGAGVTGLNSASWSAYNGSNPFIPCGYTNSLGNNTGIVPFTMPDEYGSSVTMNVPSYRGIENPFGHIFSWMDGCVCRIQSDDVGGASQFYVSTDPSKFGSADYTDYSLRGSLSRTAGYISSLIMGQYGEIMPATTGGSSITYFSDYYYISLPSTGERRMAVINGGRAFGSGEAGLLSMGVTSVATDASSIIGARLCFIPQ